MVENDFRHSTANYVKIKTFQQKHQEILQVMVDFNAMSVFSDTLSLVNGGDLLNSKISGPFW